MIVKAIGYILIVVILTVNIKGSSRMDKRGLLLAAREPNA